jgi:hypothetical protein
MRTDSDVLLYFGKFKGSTLGAVPTWYLGYLFASFTYYERQVEPELRRRGVTDGEIAGFRGKHPWLGKRPKGMGPSDASEGGYDT